MVVVCVSNVHRSNDNPYMSNRMFVHRAALPNPVSILDSPVHVWNLWKYLWSVYWIIVFKTARESFNSLSDFSFEAYTVYLHILYAAFVITTYILTDLCIEVIAYNKRYHDIAWYKRQVLTLFESYISCEVHLRLIDIDPEKVCGSLQPHLASISCGWSERNLRRSVSRFADGFSGRNIVRNVNCELVDSPYI